MRPRRILETSLYATDLVAAEEFYTRVLGFSVYEKREGRHLFFQVDEGMLLIFNPDVTLQPGVAPVHGAMGNGHVAFSIDDGEYGAWREHLAKHGVAIEKEMDWDVPGSHSIYFRDPAGNSLEFTTPRTWKMT